MRNAEVTLAIGKVPDSVLDMAPSKDFIMDLARLTVAAAWADGELANDEINALKDLLFGLDHVTESDWKVLEMYMEHPVTDEERQELLQRVVEGIHTQNHKALVLQTMRALFEADGEVTAEEEAFLREVEGVVASAGGILSLFSKAMKSAMGQRKERTEAVLREAEIEDYVENTIYYRLRREQEERGLQVSQSDAELRKCCLAAGVMARVAHVDDEISEKEKAGIAAVLADAWKLDHQLALLIAELTCQEAARTLDAPRIAYNFFCCTTHPERQQFLVLLFRVANACEGTSHDEIEEIRRIASVLKLGHEDFIAAKLTVPREERGGL